MARASDAASVASKFKLVKDRRALTSPVGPWPGAPARHDVQQTVTIDVGGGGKGGPGAGRSRAIADSDDDAPPVAGSADLTYCV
jgi:hypothetical protein